MLISFTPVFGTNASGYASLYWDEVSNRIYGNTGSNISVQGGMVTSTSAWFNQNRWANGDVPPQWFNELEMGFNASGIITASNFEIVPEPMTLSLLGLGAITALHYERRARRRLEHNPIG